MQRAVRKTLRLVVACCGLLAGILAGPAVYVVHAAEASFTVSVHGDRLTVQLDRAPLGRVLAELARQARIRVQLPSSMRADPISDAFLDMTLEQGISRLLQGRSVAMFHENPSAQSGRSGDIALTQIWILPKQGQAATVSVLDAEETWSRPAFLDDPDPAVRLAALDEFADRRDAVALDTFAQAMVDEDEKVRAKAQALFDQALSQPGAASAESPDAEENPAGISTNSEEKR